MVGGGWVEVVGEARSSCVACDSIMGQCWGRPLFAQVRYWPVVGTGQVKVLDKQYGSGVK